ncbi:hypothetical protein ACQBAR_00550 [Propionibacteriaceae bacterium Y1685]
MSSSACTAERLLHIWSAARSRSAGGLNESHLAEAVELYAGGLSLMEVGLRFGVSQQTVRRALAVEGVAIRPSGRRTQVSA